MTQWMIEYELKELRIKCSRTSRGAFDVYSQRKDQAFQWRDADSEAVVALNEMNYPWGEIISQGLCKHFFPRQEVFATLITTEVQAFTKQLEEEVS